LFACRYENQLLKISHKTELFGLLTENSGEFFIWWSDNLEMEYLQASKYTIPSADRSWDGWSNLMGYMQLYIILIFKRVWYQ